MPVAVGPQREKITLNPKRIGSSVTLVEVTGFEHATSASRTQRSTKLSHTSNYFIYYTPIISFVKYFPNFFVWVVVSLSMM